MELDWQNSFQQIKDRGAYLLQTEKWSDCRFLVGTAPNQRIISGHKIFLATASPVFERMFFGNLPDKTDPIVIPDVQPDAFQAMLEYIYSDRINISSFDKACELCYVAKKYMLPHVVEQCTHFLWADLSPKNACRAYEFAKLFDEPRLMQSSMGIIAANTRDVLADSSFLDIEVSTLMAILDQDKLNIDSELDLFNGVLKYATERGMFTDDEVADAPAHTRSSMQHSDSVADSPLDVESMNDATDPDAVVEIKMEPDVAAMMHNHEDDVAFESDNHTSSGAATSSHIVEVDDVVVLDSDGSATGADLNDASSAELAANVHSIMNAQRLIIDEAMLRQAVKKVRFLTLTPQQFAEGPARSKLLQQHEALAILIKISSPSINDCPMPEGFCSSRCTRNYYEARNQRDMSSYRHSVGPSTSTLSCLVPIEVPPHAHNASAMATTSATVHQPQPVANPNYNGDSDSDLNTSDTRRSYCVRTVNQQFDYRNTSVTDCGLTFQVDTNIWITGVQVPTQVLSGELMNSAGFSERYTEILYAHIQDMQGSRLTYTHCTSRVRYDSLLEISFDRPIYIYRNQIYKVFVVFNKVGWYPMYTCVPDVICNRVKFMFNVANPRESVRDGLIRAIVFTTPQDQSRNMIE